MPVRNAEQVVTQMSSWGMSCSGATGPITRGYKVMIASLDAWLGDCEKRTGTLKSSLATGRLRERRYLTSCSQGITNV
ncbi:hypothetical protein MTO96_040659 [Rhipicephalus appendiculatus]